MSHLTIPVPDTPTNNQHSPLPVFATRFPLRVRSESTESFHLQVRDVDVMLYCDVDVI